MSTTGVAPARGNAEARELARWQRKLLPFMSRFLVILAIAFFALSIFDVYEMRSFVRNESSQAIRGRVEELLRTKSGNLDAIQQGLLLLESDALDKRYREASALLMSRIWTRQLAFLTGMVLTFVGSAFIIGKISESPSEVNFGASDWKAGISSASPGLILAFFGSVLMGIALVVQTPVDVQDRPVYLMGTVSNAGQAKTPTIESKPSDDPFGKLDAGAEKTGAEKKGKTK